MGAASGHESVVLPPVMRRGIRWWLGLSVLFSVVTVAWVVLRRPLGLPRGGWFRYLPLVLGLVPVTVLLPWWLLRTRWIRRALVASEGRLCTHCAYDVSGLDKSGTCPECGGKYDLIADRVMWENVGVTYEDDGADGDWRGPGC